MLYNNNKFKMIIKIIIFFIIFMNNIKLSTIYFILSNEINPANQYFTPYYSIYTYNKKYFLYY